MLQIIVQNFKNFNIIFGSLEGESPLQGLLRAQNPNLDEANLT